MIIKAYDKELDGKLIFEATYIMPNPISSFLIQNHLKDVPNNYFDNSKEGFDIRLNTKTTEEDINTFLYYVSNNIILNEDGEDVTIEFKALMLFLETAKNKPTSFPLETFKGFKKSKISFFKDLYENVMDEFEDFIDNEEIKIFEMIL